MLRILCIVIITATMVGCIETQSSKGYKLEAPKTYSIPQNNVEIDSNTVFTVFGTPLPPRELSNKDRKIREEKLAESKLKFDKNPNEIENIIWYGRWLAYSGLYYEAIKIYSLGLEKFPTSHQLLRHRGHRYITIRQFDLAVEDLQKAAFYSRPGKNKVEIDGIPNRYNKSISNDKFNIFFHLGLAHYLKGNYDKAISSFKKSLTFSNNNDLLVQATDWFYLTYRKLGNEKAAEELLLPINKKMKVLENVDYLNRLLVYKGEYQAEKVLSYAENSDNSLSPILAYGIGNWYLFKGDV
ncbi:MAG: tetratricopeptide (TPR) repeat protein, partial [Cyclobacteriaceae bacterium]